jgi:4-amino-4-deoxy-L-arabinose transferase-like glycosyltransferase
MKSVGDYAPQIRTIREAVLHKVKIERLMMLVATLEQRPRVLLWLLATLVALVTFALRAVFLDRSFDVYLDEILYFRISQNVARTLQVYYDPGVPFYLHPPVFFYLEGIYLKLLQPGGDIVHQIYAVRYLNAILAGLSATMLFLLGRRTGGLHAGIVAAAIFALEPFTITTNSRNLLETLAMFCALAGFCIIFYSISKPTSWPRILGAGGLLGLALLTNEPSAYITLLPLAVCFLLNWAIPRRMAALTAAVACVINLLYVLSVAATGNW